MSFTDQKKFVCDESVVASFRHVKKRFHCKLCGHDFKVGDLARWIYANGTKGAGTGNFFVCFTCDYGTNDEIIQRAKTSFEHAVRLAKQWDIYGPDWERGR